MGRTADSEGFVEPDYERETRKIGDRFNLWHELVEVAHTSDAYRLRRLWALAGESVEQKALQDLHKGKLDNE